MPPPQLPPLPLSPLPPLPPSPPPSRPHHLHTTTRMSANAQANASGLRGRVSVMQEYAISDSSNTIWAGERQREAGRGSGRWHGNDGRLGHANPEVPGATPHHAHRRGKKHINASPGHTRTGALLELRMTAGQGTHTWRLIQPSRVTARPTTCKK